jgi:putative transposase
MTFRGGMGMGRNGRRLHVGSTDEWEQIELLCGWPEQRDYELIRPLVLFGGRTSEGAAEAAGAASERTLQRRVARFEAEGMESLFGSEHARRKRRLPDSMRQ